MSMMCSSKLCIVVFAIRIFTWSRMSGDSPSILLYLGKDSILCVFIVKSDAISMVLHMVIDVLLVLL